MGTSARIILNRICACPLSDCIFTFSETSFFHIFVGCKKVPFLTVQLILEAKLNSYSKNFHLLSQSVSHNHFLKDGSTCSIVTSYLIACEQGLPPSYPQGGGSQSFPPQYIPVRRTPSIHYFSFTNCLTTFRYPLLLGDDTHKNKKTSIKTSEPGLPSPVLLSCWSITFTSPGGQEHSWYAMDNPSTPLADYFWIAGVESISYGDSPPLPSPLHSQQPSTQLDSPIAEDSEPPELNVEAKINNASSTPKADARHSKHNGKRLSKASVETRSSIRTVEETDVTKSNRSSATIRPSPTPLASTSGLNTNSFHGLSPTTNGLSAGILIPDGMPSPGFDFDSALYKFAAERETFLDELTFSSGAKVHSRQPMISPRAERIKADEDVSLMRNPIRSIKGSIRRKISFRDMNSVKRQPPTARSGTFDRYLFIYTDYTLFARFLLPYADKHFQPPSGVLEP